MYRRLINNITQWFSLIFLVIAFICNINGISKISLMNTDGLSLLTISIAFLLLFAMKIPFIRKIVIKIILKINNNISYYLEFEFETEKMDFTTFKNYFIEQVGNWKYFLNNDYDVHFEDELFINIFHKGMAANVKLQDISSEICDFSDFEEENRDKSYWSLIIFNVNKYELLDKNISFVVNHLLDARNIAIKERTLELKINLKESELVIHNIPEWINTKKHIVKASNVEICVENQACVKVSNKQIVLEATSKGEFLQGIDIVKSVLVS